MPIEQGATNQFKIGLATSQFDFNTDTFKMALYDGKYKEALAQAKRLGDGMERSDAYRSGQFRLPPLPQNSGVA